MISGFRHTGLVVQNLDESVMFWCKTMGFSLHKRTEESGDLIDAVMELADVRVTTVKLTSPDGTLLELLRFGSHPGEDNWNGSTTSTGLTHLAFTVTNLDDMYRKLQSEGVRFHTPPTVSADGSVKMSYCRGPEGLILELVEVLPNEG